MLSQSGKHAKSQTILSDEGTLIAAREYIEEGGESKYSIRLWFFLQHFKTNQYIYNMLDISGQGLAKTLT